MFGLSPRQGSPFLRRTLGAFWTGFFFVVGILVAIGAAIYLVLFLLLKDRAIQHDLIKLVILLVIISLRIRFVRSPFRR